MALAAKLIKELAEFERKLEAAHSLVNQLAAREFRSEIERTDLTGFWGRLIALPKMDFDDA